MADTCATLIRLLSGHVLTLSDNEWGSVLRVGRGVGLLATLRDLMSPQVLAQAPARVTDQLSAAQVIAESQVRSVRFEVAEVGRALNKEDIPVVLLKGAAYTVAGLSAGRGRLFSDIDIMVPYAALRSVESGLQFRGGWLFKSQNDYDRRYYRQWMHELPPMRHRARGSELDVHHAIVPKTSRIRIPMEKVWERIVPIDGCPGFWRLSDHDLIIHSAVHLFSDGDFVNGFRDLVDIWRLLDEFGVSDGRWVDLQARAAELNAQTPMTLALYFCRQLFGIKVPLGVIAELDGLASKLLCWCCSRGLKPQHTLTARSLDSFALFLLYVRSHYLRMPFALLIPHLLRKWLVSPWLSELERRKQDKKMTMDKFMAEKKAGN